jgi:hypothetical protein
MTPQDIYKELSTQISLRATISKILILGHFIAKTEELRPEY